MDNTTESKKQDLFIKLLLIGSSAVGKSALLQQFGNEEYNANYISTIGVDFKTKMIIKPNVNIKLCLWDTAGQERFRSITSTYYRGAHGIIILYDLTDSETLDEIKSHWLSEIRQHAPENVVCYLVGNKSDIKHTNKFNIGAKEFAVENNFEHLTISAKTGENVDILFNDIINRIIRVHPEDELKIKKEIDLNQGYFSSLSSSFCCY